MARNDRGTAGIRSQLRPDDRLARRISREEALRALVLNMPLKERDESQDATVSPIVSCSSCRERIPLVLPAKQPCDDTAHATPRIPPLARTLLSACQSPPAHEAPLALLQGESYSSFLIPPRPVEFVVSAFQPALPPSLPPHLLPQSASARICQRGLGR